LSLFSNILVVGGNARLPGFRERLFVELASCRTPFSRVNVRFCREADVRAMAPAHFEVKIQPLGTEYEEF
jgi:actin-related protein